MNRQEAHAQLQTQVKELEDNYLREAGWSCTSNENHIWWPHLYEEMWAYNQNSSCNRSFALRIQKYMDTKGVSLETAKCLVSDR